MYKSTFKSYYNSNSGMRQVAVVQKSEEAKTAVVSTRKPIKT